MIKELIVLAIATIIGYLYAQYHISSQIISHFQRNSIIHTCSIYHFVNAYLINDPTTNQSILIDTGFAGNEDQIFTFLQQLQVNTLHALHLTHGHRDHVGSVKQLMQRFPQMTVGCHETEHDALQHSHVLIPTHTPRLFHWINSFLMKKNLISPPPAFTCHMIYSNVTEFYHNMKLHSTPGHSDGSVTFELYTGECIIGDLLSGGFFFCKSTFMANAIF